MPSLSGPTKGTDHSSYAHVYFTGCTFLFCALKGHNDPRPKSTTSELPLITRVVCRMRLQRRWGRNCFLCKYTFFRRKTNRIIREYVRMVFYGCCERCIFLIVEAFGCSVEMHLWTFRRQRSFVKMQSGRFRIVRLFEGTNMERLCIFRVNFSWFRIVKIVLRLSCFFLIS